MPETITLGSTLVEPIGRRGSPRQQARLLWFAAAIAANAVIIAVASWRGDVLDVAVEASLINLCIAMAARHDGIVRGAFVLGRLVRWYRLHQATYHLGQLHRATAIAGTVWFAAAVTVAAAQDDEMARAAGVAVLAVLLAMMWTARDGRRRHDHDRFEAVHRYGGWTALAVVGVMVLRQAQPSASLAGLLDLVLHPAALLLAVLVGLVVDPWVGVRRLPVEILAVTSQVVVVALPGRWSLGEFVRISREGREWHSFAVATTGGEGRGRYCLVIRRAGDWTGRLACDAEFGPRPTYLLVRRIRGYGFMYHAQSYRRVLIVATGAGIGPVLPYLLGGSSVAFECLWIGRDHRAAMGDDLVQRVLSGGKVTLVDKWRGRPDIAALVAERAERFEAVFVVSNESVRDDVASVCEALGVPWYGPTFDS